MSQTNTLLTALDTELRTRTRPPAPEYAELFGMLQYHVGWTDARGNPVSADMGKRIRPLLCLWACQAVGADWQAALPPAAAIELIHNFSLIHDDIQDQSESRRGRATVWNVWGIAHGINSGDAMFVLAQQAIKELPSYLSLERYIAVQRAFDSAILKLTEGQYLDLAFERADQVTMEQYFKMVGGKTAALLAASAKIGALLGTTDARIIESFATYGEQIGIAFQIADDVLGIWGDPELTGKSARTDLLSRKKSYPVLYAMQVTAGETLRALYAKQSWTDDDIRQVENILTETDARSAATRCASEYAERAHDALDATSLGHEALAPLRELVTQVVNRDK